MHAARRVLGKAPGGGAPGGGGTLLAHASAGSTGTSATTAAIATTGANLLIAVVGTFGTGTPTVSDSAGNTWTAAVIGTNSVWGASIFFVSAPTTSGTHTCTASWGSTNVSVAFEAYSGSSAKDQTSTFADATFLTTRQAGSITPAVNNELLIAGLCIDTNETYSIGSSFTIIDTQHTGQNLCVAWFVQSTAAAINPAWTFGSARSGASIASFR